MGGVGAWIISRWGKHLGLHDKPNSRSSHDVITPRGGERRGSWGHILNCELRNGEWAFGRTNQNDERIKVDPLDKKFLSVGLVTQLGIERLGDWGIEGFRDWGIGELRDSGIGGFRNSGI